VLDVCARLDLVEKERHTRGRDLLLQVVAMLVRMIPNLGESRAGEGKGKGKDE